MAGAVELVAGPWPAARAGCRTAPADASRRRLALLALTVARGRCGASRRRSAVALGGAALWRPGSAGWRGRGGVPPAPARRCRPTARPTILVDEGPYRFGRNPMYLGMTVTLLGIGLALGRAADGGGRGHLRRHRHRVHIPHEEAQLRRAFGGWYSDYAASVRRWL